MHDWKSRRFSNVLLDINNLHAKRLPSISLEILSKIVDTRQHLDMTMDSETSSIKLTNLNRRSNFCTLCHKTIFTLRQTRADFTKVLMILNWRGFSIIKLNDLKSKPIRIPCKDSIKHFCAKILFFSNWRMQCNAIVAHQFSTKMKKKKTKLCKKTSKDRKLSLARRSGKRKSLSA